jgi:hypothetical protein
MQGNGWRERDGGCNWSNNRKPKTYVRRSRVLDSQQTIFFAFLSSLLSSLLPLPSFSPLFPLPHSLGWVRLDELEEVKVVVEEGVGGGDDGTTNV